MSGSKLAYSPDQAAEQLSLSRSTIYTLMRSGQLEYIQLGRKRVITYAALMKTLRAMEAGDVSIAA